MKALNHGNEVSRFFRHLLSQGVKEFGKCSLVWKLWKPESCGSFGSLEVVEVLGVVPVSDRSL